MPLGPQEDALQKEAWRDPDSVFNYVRGSSATEEVDTAGAAIAAAGAVTELEVAINEKGSSAIFRHTVGMDPYAEAAAFCAENVPAVPKSACQRQLVTALEQHLVSLRTQDQAAEAANRGSGTSEAFAVANLIGPGLLRPGGNGEVAPTTEMLRGTNVVALYFAADWCKPCRQFTPILTKYHNMVRNFRKKNFEVVWVTASKSQEGFDSYFGEMPWPAVPFDQQHSIQALQAKYKVESFPSLVFVDAATGGVLVQDARKSVMNDPNGAGFPYSTPIQVFEKNTFCS